jgi:hypothetical protein
VHRPAGHCEMGISTWRRLHGHDLTANVIVMPSGSYEVAASHEPSGAVRRGPRAFTRLESAKAAADDLVRRTFGHTCSVDACGEWMIWNA